MTHDEAKDILDRLGLKAGDNTRSLTGAKRAEAKAALNFLAANPPKKKRAKKKPTT